MWLVDCTSSLGEITEEPPGAICEDLDALLREVDEERARDLQEESSTSVGHLPPQVGSEAWRRLNGIHWMRPGPGKRAQRATRPCPYLRRDSSRCPAELWGPGGSGGCSPCPSSSSLGVINPSLLWGAQGLPPSLSGRSGVRKLDLSHLCFSLNFYFPMFLSQFPSMFPLLTYPQSLIPLIC